MTTISLERRDQIIDALRRGTVPQSSLDAFAVGLERFEPALDEELRKVSAGGGGLQGGPRRVRLRQDLLRPLAGRSRPQDGVCADRGAGLRDRDAAAPAGDGLPPAERAAVDGGHAPGRLRNVVDGWFLRWRRTSWPRARSIRVMRRSCSSAPTSCSSAGSPTWREPRRRSVRRCGATGRRKPTDSPRWPRECSPGSPASRTSPRRPSDSPA